MSAQGDALERIQAVFDEQAGERARWKKKNWYYHSEVTRFIKFLIPEGSRVLEIGSGDGDLLAELKPARGLGIDASPRFVEEARRRHPGLEFCHGFAETLSVPEKFDYVVLANLVGFLFDVQKVFDRLHAVCLPSTRIVIHYYNFLWEPVLSLADRLGMRMRQGVQNWLSLQDLENLLHISGFEAVTKVRKILFPVSVPFLSGFLNRVVANLPLVHRLALGEFVVARSLRVQGKETPSASVVVPCKNEKGNIRELVERTPELPGGMEMIFVDGASTDGTREEIERMKALHPEKNIRLVDQGDSTGKGAAVRLGFDNARGDVLIILDADISVAPEDILKFHKVLVEGTGEFINGTRLVYPMEGQAMRFLNILANKFFSLAFTYLLDQRIRDTLCGTKVLYRADYERIARNRSFFGAFDPFGDFDLLFGAAKLNMRILEVPVRYHERRYGVTKIKRFRHGLLLLGMCLVALRKLKFV